MPIRIRKEQECLIKDCGKPAHMHGHCQAHWQSLTPLERSLYNWEAEATEKKTKAPFKPFQGYQTPKVTENPRKPVDPTPETTNIPPEAPTSPPKPNSAQTQGNPLRRGPSSSELLNGATPVFQTKTTGERANEVLLHYWKYIYPNSEQERELHNRYKLEEGIRAHVASTVWFLGDNEEPEDQDPDNLEDLWNL